MKSLVLAYDAQSWAGAGG